MPQIERHITSKLGKPEIRFETFMAMPHIWQMDGAITDRRKILA